MPRIDDEDKRQRLERIHLLLTRNARGLTEVEISDEINLGRRTVNNYLRELEFQGKALKDGLYWYPLVLKEARLRPFDLLPEEAVTLYLGARLLSKQQDKRNEPAETALLKLASVLKADAGVGDEIEQAAHELAQRPVQKGYQPVFREVVRGYIYRKKIEITYRPLNWNKAFQTTFSTYLLEPSPIGFTTYLIGHSSIVNDRRAYKLERIESIRLTKDDYSIPPEFPGLDILRNAWSIIAGEETLRVVLRFSPNVQERVLETRWHTSQETMDDPDKPGWLRWQVKVADTLDLLPWIRGWGADVEVLEPERLRKTLEQEIKRMMHLYQIATPEGNKTEQRLLRLWGKTGKNGLDFHPALLHMLDVGNIAYHLLNMSQSYWCKALSRAFNTDAENLAGWLPWLVALHDIGKISIPFQAQKPSQKARLEREGFSFGQWKPKDQIHHTDIGRVFLKFEFDETNISSLQHSKLHEAWIEMIGGHHGVFAGLRGGTDSLSRINKHLKSLLQADEWPQFRKQADWLLRSLFLLKTPEKWPEPENLSAAIMALTGFTILCDWLGSDERYFTPHPDIGIREYAPHSRNQAQRALDDAGFFNTHKSQASIAFSELFPDRTPPRPLQQAIDDIPDEILLQPCLAIIEAPTGEGKTEAALALAHRIAQYSGTDAFYCALPTQATSNQMFQRLQTHLQQRLGLQVKVKLIHGQAFLVEDDLRPEPLGDVNNIPHPSLEWFGPQKRALIAPFGVGTVDQAELSALNVRHNALRLIGLAGKVVILDEVHAYDTYMTTIIQQMLRWLSSLGSSVILLSATLPQSRRADLAKAYGISSETEPSLDEDYPSLWVGSRNGIHHVSPTAYQPKREFSLKHLHISHDDAAGKARWLLDKVVTGGCGCWITNTVERAQKLYSALKSIDPTIDIFLLHARFPVEERQKLESDITKKFGPDGKRPQRSLVIGTQVLEQSLDLDFDFMVSDLAPIDLLLQRMGRLHRHENIRPMAHQNPTLWVNSESDPTDENRVLMGADQFYHEYILQKTWQTIVGKEVIWLPEDYRPLVEAVYTPDAPEIDNPIYPAWQKLQNQEVDARSKARQYLLPDPDPRRAFCNANQVTFEEDEGNAAWFVAQTRLGAESITVLPLERDGNKARLYPIEEWIDLTNRPTRDMALRLLRRTLRISQPDVIAYLQNQGNPTGAFFRETPLLKSVYPLWLENGELEVSTGKKTLKLIMHPEQGLVIEIS